MSKKWKVILGIAVAVVAIGAVSYGAVQDYFIKSNPVNYLMYAAAQQNFKAVDATAEMDFSLDPQAFQEANPDADIETVTFINDILSNLDASMNVKMAYDETGAFDLYEAFYSTYNGNDLLSAVVQVDEQQFLFDIPEILPTPITETYQNLISYYEADGSTAEMIDMKPYVQILMNTSDDAAKALDPTIYLPAVQTFLEPLTSAGTESVDIGGTTYKLDKLVMDTNYSDMIQMMVSMLESAKTDEAMKAFVKNRLEALLTQLETSGDYEKLGMTEIDLEDFKTELDTNYDEDYASFLDEGIAAYQDMLAQMEDSESGVPNITMTLAFYIDGNDMLIRRVAYDYSIQGISISQAISYLAYGDAVEIPVIGDQESTGLIALTEDPDTLNAYVQELLMTGVDGFVNSQAVADLMKDLDEKSASLPSYSQEEVQSVVSGYEMYKDGIGEMLYNYYLMFFTGSYQ